MCLQDICISAGFALLLFVTGIPLAVYANQWDDEIKAAEDDVKDTLEKIPPALRAASVRELSPLSHLHCFCMPLVFTLFTSYNTFGITPPPTHPAGILLHCPGRFHSSPGVDVLTPGAGLVQTFRLRQPRHMRSGILLWICINCPISDFEDLHAHAWCRINDIELYS